MCKEAAVEHAVGELVIANRILAREDVIDDFGHVSVRHPTDPERFLLSCSRSPAIVTRDDIMEYSLDGEPFGQNGRRIYAERFIHGAIYAARPEIHAVTHHHARSVLPFTVTGVALRPVFHMGSVIGAQPPMWDSADEFGDTNMLVDTLEMGRSMARTLGDGRVVLLRGHGSVCAAESLRAVCMVSVYLKENAEAQFQALALGEPHYLSPGEIEKASTMLLGEMPLARAWDYWTARAGFRGL